LGYAASLGISAAGVLPRPPLAVNDNLAAAADFRAADMAATGVFTHVSSDGRTANKVVADFGYALPIPPFPATGNNVESIYMGPGPVALFMKKVFGSSTHRNHLLGQAGYASHHEIGFGQSVSADGVSWFAVLTAFRSGAQPFVTGVVFADLDGDGVMDLGEGLPDVTVSVAGGGSATTNAGGGWSIPVGAGAWTVTASGGGFVGPSSATVTVVADNVEVDFISGSSVQVTDYQLCEGLRPTIIGTAGDDVIRGTSRADIIQGLGGNDTIYGRGGSDTICGGAGNDTIYGGSGNDTIYGGSGDDTIYGESGNDRLYGQSGNDRLVGGLGYDRVKGGGGTDRCSGEYRLSCERR
jgi:serralysin